MDDDAKTTRIDPVDKYQGPSTTEHDEPKVKDDPAASNDHDGSGKRMDHSGKIIITISVLAMIVVLGRIAFIDGNHGSAPSTPVTTSSSYDDASKKSEAPSPSESSKTVDLNDLKGQKWSNAKKIVKSRGGDLSNALVLTDDGKEPVVDSNWTVKDISQDANGLITVHLTHDSSDVDVSGPVSGLKDAGEDAWNSVKDGTVGLGQH